MKIGRLPFVIFAFINLLIGITAGLIRIGWNIPLTPVAIHHGAIMVGGFLGTLILLEKVISLKKKILFIFPILNALSIIMIWPAFSTVGQILLLIGAAGLAIVHVLYLKRQHNDLSVLLMLIGACCLLIGHTLLISKSFYPAALPWWMGFILFTIVGERLELSKFLPVTKIKKNILLLYLILFVTGICIPFHSGGKYISGIALALISLWLMQNDIISVSLKKKGVTKFSACALLSGYICLLITGVFLISFQDLQTGYDAIIHTFFLGFTFLMIFAHGPFILPGVLGINVKPYHTILYLPVIILLVSLIIRILSDMMILSYSLRSISGWITAGGLFLYFILLITLTARRPDVAKAF